MHVKIALLGFGNVHRALARLLLRKTDVLRDDYDLTVSVTCIATHSRGFAIDPAGLDLDRALQLVDAGHTVLAVEHHPHLLAACDWIIELGPVGGAEGGKIIATGTPEDVMKMETPTAPYLRELLEVIP